jgi:alpha-mannosidase
MFGIDNMDAPDPNRYYHLNSADIVIPNMDAWRVMWDFDTLHQLVNDLPDDSSLAKRALWAANNMMNVFVEGDVGSLEACREAARGVLGENWVEEIQKESETAEKQKGTLWGVGHWCVTTLPTCHHS